LALAIIVICTLMLILDATVMNVALPRIQNGLHFSSTDLAWVMNAYTLTFGGLLLLGGRVGDILGRRRTFMAGIALFTLASLAGGLATTGTWLIVARCVQGVGAAIAGPSTIALVVTSFTDPRERLKALALMSGMASAGFAIGLIVGGVLTELASWRWVLFINVPFGIAALLLTPRYVREPERHPSGLDIPGAVLATGGVGALVNGLIRAAGHGFGDRAAQLSLAIGAVLVVAFIIVEARVRQPLLPLRLFRDRNRAAGYLIFFIGPASMMSTFFFLTQYIQDIQHADALVTGLEFLPLAAGMLVMTRLIPHLLPRFGPKPLSVTGTALMAIGLLWLTQLHNGSGYVDGLLGPMILMGIGGGIGFAPLNPVIMAGVPAKDVGAASGVVQTMQQTGGALGLAVLVAVFGNSFRHAVPSQAFVTAMTTAFAVAAGIASTAFVVAWTFRGRRPAS
jgi:EmrB/QacA subfamily drug resistance transporter